MNAWWVGEVWGDVGQIGETGGGWSNPLITQVFKTFEQESAR